MENKTISHLNNKVWYRLIKVIYIVAILIAITISSAIIVDSNSRRFDNGKSYVICYDGKKSGLKDISVYLNSDYVPSYYENDIRQFCLTNSDLGEIAKSKYPQYNDFSNEEVGKRLKENNSFFLKSVLVQTKNYSLTPIYTNRNWFITIGECILGALVILLISETIKRVFYYIVLGSLRPKKN
jgi:hypothetical protein